MSDSINPGPAGGIDTLKRNALILTIVGFLCGGVIPGVLGLVSFLQADTNPDLSRKIIKWTVIIWVALIVIGIIIGVIAAATGAFTANVQTY
ncbi:MAG: hypothetical protein Q4G40_07690 [Brachybacterium sp.]|nr:hypothetical protein [Brachybacterium sp.]